MAKKQKLNTLVLTTSNAEETRTAGAEFSKLLKPGDIVFLKGNLGYGKTTFVQGVLRGLGYKKFARSSSFNLVSEYNFNKFKLYHLDLYRLDASDVWKLGIEEYLFSENITLIEWADRIKAAEPLHTWLVEIKGGGSSREIKITKVGQI
ncbi:MAG: tRNA (adenosine(37)-N6)-threonylcarbamoyltransferase complex ATPase subunit type 1 TsaE [Elusimicrobia bacterium]|nr:tRNA (adenosine(37)-N6)-threonylcarbamoyltransferase complex ATPase subunit type 1 TsaE [Elusimicrobiota bacterium]